MIKKCSIFLNNNSSGILISQVLFPKGRQINNTDHGKNNDLNYVKKKKKIVNLFWNTLLRSKIALRFG